MVDKDKKAPIPERKQADDKPDRRNGSDPQFVRGTIDPSTKKGGR